jgi:hypothetical protein
MATGVAATATMAIEAMTETRMTSGETTKTAAPSATTLHPAQTAPTATGIGSDAFVVRSEGLRRIAGVVE